jgi:hypothetical protein
MMAGVVIRTFLVDGIPDGLRTVELSNATVLGTIFPRPSVAKFMTRQAADSPGVYILIGPSGNDSKSVKIYVGEGDPVGDRLKSHVSVKEFWTQAAVFTSKDAYITKTQIKYLEAALIEAAKSAARVILDNKNTPKPPKISESGRTEVEDFFDKIKLLLGVSGFNFLKSWEEPVARVQKDGKIFQYSIQKARARMIRSASSYVVLEGSTARASVSASAQKWARNLRAQLIEAEVLVPCEDETLLRFTKNASFPSSSAAAVAVAGGNKNGPISWKLKNGTTLKEIEASEQ